MLDPVLEFLIHILHKPYRHLLLRHKPTFLPSTIAESFPLTTTPRHAMKTVQLQRIYSGNVSKGPNVSTFSIHTSSIFIGHFPFTTDSYPTHSTAQPP